MTVLLLVCSYLGQEFVRVGYYVDNDYEDSGLREAPPSEVNVDLLQRNILADKPRVTRFGILWDSASLKSKPEIDLPEELKNIVSLSSSEYEDL